MVDQREQHNAFRFIMPSFDYVQTKEARVKRLMVLHFAGDISVGACCLRRGNIVAARSAEQRDAGDLRCRVAADAYSRAEPLRDECGERAERSRAIRAAYPDAADVFRR